MFLYKVHFVKLNKLLTVNPCYTDGTDCVNVPQLALCLLPVLLEPPACFVSSLPVFSVPFVTSLKTKDRAVNVSVLVCSLTCETSRGRTFWLAPLEQQQMMELFLVSHLIHKGSKTTNILDAPNDSWKKCASSVRTEQMKSSCNLQHLLRRTQSRLQSQRLFDANKSLFQMSKLVLRT